MKLSSVLWFHVVAACSGGISLTWTTLQTRTRNLQPQVTGGCVHVTGRVLLTNTLACRLLSPRTAKVRAIAGNSKNHLLIYLS